MINAAKEKGILKEAVIVEAPPFFIFALCSIHNNSMGMELWVVFPACIMKKKPSREVSRGLEESFVIFSDPALNIVLFNI